RSILLFTSAILAGKTLFNPGSSSGYPESRRCDNFDARQRECRRPGGGPGARSAPADSDAGDEGGDAITAPSPRPASDGPPPFPRDTAPHRPSLPRRRTQAAQSTREGLFWL